MPILLVLLLCVCACSNGDDSGDPTTEHEEQEEHETTDIETFDDQVELGMELYGEYCAECHGDSGQGTSKAPRVVGLDEGALPLDPAPSSKVRTEQFVTVADVASFVVMNMPADDPGSLSNDEYLAILAFDLKANGLTLEQPLDLELAETLTIPR
jgi:cytochrome c